MRVGIVGLGLIGGSMGIDLRRLGWEVLGLARRPEVCERALERGLCDQASTDPALLGSADLIVLATPLGVLEASLRELRPHLQASAVVTDVGSVKGPVVAALEPVWPRFVGGHPMAGTSESGVEAALADLFVGRPYVVTPTAQSDSEAIACVEALAVALRADLLRCDPWAHDRSVAAISHLPVLVSAALLRTCETEPDAERRQLARQLASSGFRDTSRVGAGNPQLGTMMARYNREALLELLGRYQTQIADLAAMVAHEDWPALEETLRLNQAARPGYLTPEDSVTHG